MQVVKSAMVWLDIAVFDWTCLSWIYHTMSDWESSVQWCNTIVRSVMSLTKMQRQTSQRYLGLQGYVSNVYGVLLGSACAS